MRMFTEEEVRELLENQKRIMSESSHSQESMNKIIEDRLNRQKRQHQKEIDKLREEVREEIKSEIAADCVEVAYCRLKQEVFANVPNQEYFQ